jgi:hypothetical protein
MAKLISACGIDCATCECREATLTNDNDLRREVAGKWSQMYDAELTAENINCQGCMQPGAHFAHCDECDIRACVIAKGIANCAKCPDYACEKLERFLGFVPQAKANLEELRA